MKKEFLLVLFMFLGCGLGYSQIKLKTYTAKIDKGYKLLADNDEYCPVSVKVDFTLNNMRSSEGNHKIFVVPARTKGFVISKLTYIKRGRYGYRYKTKMNYGNHDNNINDTSYIYDLPFEKNTPFLLYQGYNGKFSHQNENSLDFTMPINTNIYAAREGIVVKVVDKNNKTCPTKACIKYNNLIRVYHADGSFSEYVHLKQNGSLVSEGESISKGQLIGKSGNVGFSTGPHLHFVVFNQKIEGRETLKTKFRVNKGNEVVFLKEKKSYKRSY